MSGYSKWPTIKRKKGAADAKQLLQLLEKLEDHEDVQKVYSNFDLDASKMSTLI